MQLREMLAIVLEELTDVLKDADQYDSMCAVTVYPGIAVPVDYVGGDECGGMAWVRHVSSNPTSRFPNADITVDNCAYSLAHTMEVGIVRPSPIPESDGSTVDLPDDAAHMDSAFDIADDMMLMKLAIQNAAKTIDFVILGSYSPLGPEGGAVGGTWSLVVGDDDDG
jgi:hypothetical protein